MLKMISITWSVPNSKSIKPVAGGTLPLNMLLNEVYIVTNNGTGIITIIDFMEVSKQEVFDYLARQQMEMLIEYFGATQQAKLVFRC